MNRLKSSLSILLSLLLPVAVTLPAHAAATSRTNITVNCDLGEENEDDHNIVEGDRLKIRLLNCGGETIFDVDDLGNSTFPGNVVLSSSGYTIPNNDVTLTVRGVPTDGTFLAANIAMSNGVYVLDIDVYIAGDAFEPSSTLLQTRKISMPLGTSDMMIREAMIGDATGDSGSGDVYIGGDPSCVVEPGRHVYRRVDFVVTRPGDYDFRVVDVSPFDEDMYWGVAQNPSSDPFVALYSDFDPANPEANVLGCNDDGDKTNIAEIDTTWDFTDDPSGPLYDSLVTNRGYVMDNQFSWFRASDLEPGTYALVFFPYRAISSDEFQAGTDTAPFKNSFSWDPAPQSVTIEAWGPNGGIVSDEDLAPTGGVDSTIALWAGLAVLGVGVAVGARRRREAMVSVSEMN